jgi:hypothetical protein
MDAVVAHSAGCGMTVAAIGEGGPIQRSSSHRTLALGSSSSMVSRIDAPHAIPAVVSLVSDFVSALNARPEHSGIDGCLVVSLA